jgi:hypothetical protein
MIFTGMGALQRFLFLGLILQYHPNVLWFAGTARHYRHALDFVLVGCSMSSRRIQV